LISAVNVAGLFNNRVFAQRAGDEWTMLVVLDVERTDDESSVTAEFLDSREKGVDYVHLSLRNPGSRSG
jgi:hypothetical protein